MDSHNQTFVVSEVAYWDSNKSFQKTEPIAIQETNLTGKRLFQRTSIEIATRSVNDYFLNYLKLAWKQAAFVCFI